MFLILEPNELFFFFFQVFYFKYLICSFFPFFDNLFFLVPSIITNNFAFGFSIKIDILLTG